MQICPKVLVILACAAHLATPSLARDTYTDDHAPRQAEKPSRYSYEGIKYCLEEQGLMEGEDFRQDKARGKVVMNFASLREPQFAKHLDDIKRCAKPE